MLTHGFDMVCELFLRIAEILIRVSESDCSSYVLPYLPCVIGPTNMSKQCRSTSDGAELFTLCHSNTSNITGICFKMDIRLYRIVHIDLAMRKRVFMHMRRAKSQISLRIAHFDQSLR